MLYVINYKRGFDIEKATENYGKITYKCPNDLPVVFLKSDLEWKEIEKALKVHKEITTIM